MATHRLTSRPGIGGVHHPAALPPPPPPGGRVLHAGTPDAKGSSTQRASRQDETEAKVVRRGDFIDSAPTRGCLPQRAAAAGGRPKLRPTANIVGIYPESGTRSGFFRRARVGGGRARSRQRASLGPMSTGYRSRTTTQGRNMAGARSFWRATGMKDADFEKPIIAIANSFTQFVPGHVHLHDVGQRVKTVIDATAAGAWSSTPSRSTTASPWGTAECCIRCPAAS